MPIIEHNGFEVNFTINLSVPKPDGVYLRLTDYQQNDGHSCGYIAALTVAHYFRPGVTSKEVLKLVGPATNGITERKQIVDALNLLGITARLRKDLTVGDLKYHIRHKTLVILTVWPEGYPIDHWCVVKGFNADEKKIYLVNHESLSIKEFKKQWYECYNDEYGWGLVCRKDD